MPGFKMGRGSSSSCPGVRKGVGSAVDQSGIGGIWVGRGGLELELGRLDRAVPEVSDTEWLEARAEEGGGGERRSEGYNSPFPY